MKAATPVHVPRLGVNEDEVLLCDWAVAEGDRVEEGALLCTVESSKASSDVHADTAGWIHLRASAGQRVPVRAEIAVILRTKDTEIPAPAAPVGAATAPPGDSPTDTPSPAPDAPEGGGRRARSIAAALGVEAGSTTAVELLRRARHRDAYPVAIYGAALGGRVVAEYLTTLGSHRAAFFLDDAPNRSKEVTGLPVRPGDDLEGLPAEGVRHAFVAIGRGRTRLAVMDRAREAGLELITIVHPRAFVAPSATLGEGALVKAGAVVGTHSAIGRGAIVDNGAVVPHDNAIGAGALVAPGAALGSGIRVGQ